MSKNRLWGVRAGLLGAVLAGLALAGGVAGAQAPPSPADGPHEGEVETDPIRCWWKTDTAAVYIAEQFNLTLTCGVIETSTIRVVPQRVELEPGTLQLSPFEIVGGESFDDIEAPPWRYFQYQYRVRLMSDGFFGQDVEIPPLRVVYNIESVENDGAEGLDQAYLLPSLSVRVLSLVPPGADDIRDASADTFGAVEARRFRSTEEFVAAMILFGFAAALVALALVRAFGRYRARVPVVRTLPARRVLGACLAELGRVRADVARDGWTPELAGRALAVLRTAGAVALGRPIAQAFVPAHEPAREGQLVVRAGLLGTKRALASGAATIGAINRRLGAAGARRPPPNPRTRVMLEEIRDGLAAFNAVRYGRHGHADAAALDRALDNGAHVIRQLRWLKLRPAWLASTPGTMPRVGGVEWSS